MDEQALSNVMKTILRLLVSGFLVLLIALGVFLIPKRYNVEAFKARENTQFWTLSDDTKIGYFKIAGKGSKPLSPIIYLHGGPGGIITDEVIESYKSLHELGHDLYFYDQIGSGHSDRLADIEGYSVKRHRKDLEEIVNLIGAKEIILIGHSWGACLALNFLQHNPEKVAQMILSSPGPILPMDKSFERITAPDSLQLKAPQFSNREGNIKAANWKSTLVHKIAFTFHLKAASDAEMDDFFTHLNQELIKSTDCRPRANPKVHGGGGFYSHIMTANGLQEVIDKRSILKNLNTPLLILKGQCDNQKWGYTQEYLSLLRNTKLRILDGAGHDILRAENDTALKLITNFLEEHHARQASL